MSARARARGSERAHVAARTLVRREAHAPTKFHWPARLARLLGTMTDAALAKLAELHWTTVREERTRRGIAPFRPRRPPFEWTRDAIELLGTAMDKEVAAWLGISSGSVYRKRRNLGIAAHVARRERKSAFWTAERLARLGTVSDGALARRFKISTAAVAYRRDLLGIPPHTTHPRVRWTAAGRRLLGTMPDAALAQRLGIGARAVREERQQRGIASFRAPRAKVKRRKSLRALLALPTLEVCRRSDLSPQSVFKLRRELGVPAPPRPTKWTPSALARLGRVPDGELARELGLEVDTVRKKREKRGILKRVVRRWTREEERLARTLPVELVAAKTGRSLGAVRRRVSMLRRSSPARPWR